MPADPFDARQFGNDALDREFRSLSNAQPDLSVLAELSRKLPPARAVRPLPSNRALITCCVLGVLLLALVIGLAVGLEGWRARHAEQIAWEYLVLGVSVCLLSVAVVQQMIPATRQSFSTRLAVVLPLLGLAVVVAALYSDWRVSEFVHQGVPCLRLALLCAIPAGLLCFGLMRRGFLTDPIHAAGTAGALSGLTGVAVLALHCPLLNAPHILVWHLGAIILAALVGALIGWLVSVK